MRTERTGYAPLALVLAGVLSPQDQAAPPSLALAPLFGDHMVLPQATAVPVTGRAAPGLQVQLAAPWLEAPVVATADAAGAFELTLQTPAAGGPHVLQLSAVNGEQMLLEDVLVGDVWLGSGQSNMEMPLGAAGDWRLGVTDWQQQAQQFELPQLRLFTVQRRTAATPQTAVDGQWVVCTPATAAEFSAVALYFGRALQQHRREPLGLCVSCWGGTPAEAWTPAAGIGTLPQFGADLDLVAAAARGDDPMATARAAFWRGVDAHDPEIAGRNPPDVDFDDSDWVAVEMPHQWAGELERFDGVGWYRRIVDVPASWAGHELVLSLGPIDDMDHVWFAGTRIGGVDVHGRWQEPRVYRVPAGLVAAGPTAIAVRVLDTGGEGGFRGSAEAMRLQPAAGEQGALSLSGRWTFARAANLQTLGRFPGGNAIGPGRATVLWNGMIAPLVRFPFRGVIWYQGEANVQRAAEYGLLFPTMITAWRRAFGRELPFLFAQIAPFGYPGDTGELFALRRAQEQALQLPATAMACTVDVGDARDIHPRRKQPVGERLALAALAMVHGDTEVEWQPPRAVRAVAEGATVRVRLAPAVGGLRSADGGPPHFELAGADGAFHAAVARIDGKTVVVEAAAVQVPVQVRYCHAAAAIGELWSDSGQPVVPFELAVER